MEDGAARAWHVQHNRGMGGCYFRTQHGHNHTKISDDTNIRTIKTRSIEEDFCLNNIEGRAEGTISFWLSSYHV